MLVMLPVMWSTACPAGDEPPAGDLSAKSEPAATVEAVTEAEPTLTRAATDEPATSDTVTGEPLPAGDTRVPEPATPPSEPDSLPIFDTHAHYNQDAWARFAPAEIITILDQANVPRVLVSSSPDDGTRRLYELDPDRIVPFLRPYHAQIHSGNWFEESAVIPYLRARLETPIYQGIGEFHLHFEGHADAPIVRETAQMAVERGFYLHVHSNAQAVRTILGYEPEVKILWAHAGLSESPEVISEMLDDYDHLWIDTSIRQYQIAPNGDLDPAWRALFLNHPDRITVGSDTWVPSRWGQYLQIIFSELHIIDSRDRYTKIANA